MKGLRRVYGLLFQRGSSGFSVQGLLGLRCGVWGFRLGFQFSLLGDVSLVQKFWVWLGFGLRPWLRV